MTVFGLGWSAADVVEVYFVHTQEELIIDVGPEREVERGGGQGKPW